MLKFEKKSVAKWLIHSSPTSHVLLYKHRRAFMICMHMNSATGHSGKAKDQNYGGLRKRSRSILHVNCHTVVVVAAAAAAAVVVVVKIIRNKTQ